MADKSAPPQVQGAPDMQVPPTYQDSNGHQMSKQQPVLMQGTQSSYATPLDRLQDVPAPVDCPACGQRALTKTEFVSGNTTKIWRLRMLILFGLIGLGISLAARPKRWKDVKHACGNCGTKLARWERTGRTQLTPPMIEWRNRKAMEEFYNRAALENIPQPRIQEMKDEKLPAYQ